MSKTRCCPFCQCLFWPSVFRPQQVVCSTPECQRQHRTNYHRHKLRTEPEYRQVARDSQRKWRQAHPDYLRHYFAQHAEAVARNRQLQQRRDQKRRIRLLEKNNLALDLKGSAGEVWLVGPQVKNLEKNNLAPGQVLIFQAVNRQRWQTAMLEKNNHLVSLADCLYTEHQRHAHRGTDQYHSSPTLRRALVNAQDRASSPPWTQNHLPVLGHTGTPTRSAATRQRPASGTTGLIGNCLCVVIEPAGYLLDCCGLQDNN